MHICCENGPPFGQPSQAPSLRDIIFFIFDFTNALTYLFDAEMWTAYVQIC